MVKAEDAHVMRKNAERLAQVMIPLLMSVLLLGACASIPRASMSHAQSYDGAPEQAEAPRCTDICWIMSARNDNYYEARVYINGQRVAALPGMTAKDVRIPIKRSMLDAAGCMVVAVKLFPDTKGAYSSRECPASGSRLELSVGTSYGGFPLHVWVNQWRT